MLRFQLGMGTGTVATALDLQEGLVCLNSRTGPPRRM
jgi:hypothetical protein